MSILGLCWFFTIFFTPVPVFHCADRSDQCFQFLAPPDRSDLFFPDVLSSILFKSLKLLTRTRGRRSSPWCRPPSRPSPSPPPGCCRGPLWSGPTSPWAGASWGQHSATIQRHMQCFGSGFRGLKKRSKIIKKIILLFTTFYLKIDFFDERIL